MAVLTFGAPARSLLRWAAAAAIALIGLGIAPGHAASLATAVEATFLFKFAPFVEWPAGTDSASGDFVICVVGADPFDGSLDRAVAGERIGNRPIVLRRLGDVAPDKVCEIMYIGGSSRQSVAAALATVAGHPVLTVTDRSRNGGPPGIINFVVQNDRVRFEIDEEGANRSGLRISSKLLNLAVSVRRRT